MFKQIGQSLDINEVKASNRLEGEVLKHKSSRDTELAAIIRGEDSRFLLVIGPCSADNGEAALEYAHRLAALQERVADKIFIIMRVYTAKPRTNGDGYKGMIHSPNPMESQDLINGIRAVREIHAKIITETGLTTADEMLYAENLSLVDDLVSYHVVGARSVEDQTHRFVASGVDAPVGMKNPTSANLNVMFNAIHAAQSPQSFLYNHAEVKTTGNSLAHAVLRGGKDEYGRYLPNYHMEKLQTAISSYQRFGLLNPFIMIDTNHDNSGKQFMEQIRIVREVLMNRAWDETVCKYVRGLMIESYLEDGRQDEAKIFGKSLTDPCLGWEKTEQLVSEIYSSL